MSLSLLAISQNRTVTAYERLHGTNTTSPTMQQAALLPEVAPISPIGKANESDFDKNDISMQRVKEYERNVLGMKTDDDTPILSAIPQKKDDDTNKTAGAKETGDTKDTNDTKKADASKNSDKTSTVAGKELSDDEQKLVEELKRIDTEVRAHEAAHLAAAGGLAQGGPSFTYTQGPDGNQYATGGEVNVSMDADSSNPDATIQNMQTVIAAAMAPADPSGQDFSVAASARQIIAQMQQLKTQKATEENSDSIDTKTQATAATQSPTKWQNTQSNSAKTNTNANSTTDISKSQNNTSVTTAINTAAINNQLETYKKYNKTNFFNQPGSITNFVA
ncbi:MAG: hypothetical protein LBO69_07585 [Ignavibacteria bacterium]|jgi:hypothetical protein|nr:hypothetical protein [Ignavibacteria bacterium]